MGGVKTVGSKEDLCSLAPLMPPHSERSWFRHNLIFFIFSMAGMPQEVVPVKPATAILKVPAPSNAGLKRPLSNRRISEKYLVVPQTMVPAPVPQVT